MKVKDTHLIYENPLPLLRSRQSAFPFLCECADGSLLAIHSIGEAFESVDQVSFVSKSRDGGKTWSEPRPLMEQNRICGGGPVSFCCKPTLLEDGRILALGYGFWRKDSEKPLGNPVTGGLLDDFVFWTVSRDGGDTWSDLKEISCSWGNHVEASAPVTVLNDGSWVTPITGFPAWDGKMTGPMCGCLLRSEDQGKTWQDDAVCMEFPGRTVTCYEQRICQLESGILLCVGWNEDNVTGNRLENHYTVSYDNGKTWEEPRGTGVMGQASSLCALGGERLLALHAVRRDTDRPGIYGYLVDFSDRTWKKEEELLIWEPDLPIRKDKNVAEIFSYLKFGQPGAIKLQDHDVLMAHWYAQEGQYKTAVTRIGL